MLGEVFLSGFGFLVQRSRILHSDTLRDSITGFNPRLRRWRREAAGDFGFGCADARRFSGLATWSSSSAIRAAAVLAVRLASLPLVREVALARSRASRRARSSSLLSLGADEGTTTRAGFAVATLASLPAQLPVGRAYGPRPLPSSLVVSSQRVPLVLACLLSGRTQPSVSPPTSHPPPARQRPRAPLACFAGLKSSLREAAI